MERRTFEGHMDWEYQNSHGPVDASSPFSQIGKRNFMGEIWLFAMRPSTEALCPLSSNALKDLLSAQSRRRDSPTRLQH